MGRRQALHRLLSRCPLLAFPQLMSLRFAGASLIRVTTLACATPLDSVLSMALRGGMAEWAARETLVELSG